MNNIATTGPLNRRRFMELTGAAALAAGLGGRAFGQGGTTDLVIQLNWLETGDFAPLFASELKGFDLANGISQSFIPGGPQVDPVQSVAAGSATVGIAASIGQCALARAAGIPIKIFGALNRQSPVGLISLADDPILTPQDAVGKRIGLQGGARLPWSIILRANGMTESQMTILPVAGDITPLVNRQVSGFWGTAVNQHIALKRQGIENNIMTRNEVGAPEHFLVLFAMEETIEKRHDDIVAWLRSTIQGQRYYMQNGEEVAAYIVDRSPSLGFNPDLIREQVAAIAGFVNPPDHDLPLLRIDEAGAAKAISQLAEQDSLPAEVSLEDLLVSSLLDEAYASLE